MKFPLMLVATALLLLPACQTTTTATSPSPAAVDETGIVYGMSKAEVIKRSSRTDRIISTQGDVVIAEGVLGPGGQTARKTYLFQDGKLKVVTNTML